MSAILRRRSNQVGAFIDSALNMVTSIIFMAILTQYSYFIESGIDFGTRCLFHLMDLTDFASLIGVVVGASVIFCVGSFTNLA